jgi:hypothetical protein
MEKPNSAEPDSLVSTSRIYNIIFRLRFVPLVIICTTIFLLFMVFSYETLESGDSSNLEHMELRITEQMQDILRISSGSMISYTRQNYNTIDGYLVSIISLTNYQNLNPSSQLSDSNIQNFSLCGSANSFCWWFDDSSLNSQKFLT